MFHFQGIEPNDQTLAAIVEAERGDLVEVGSVAELMDELNEDDSVHAGY